LVRVRPQSMAVIRAPAAVPGSPPCTCAMSMQYPSEPASSRLKIEPSHGGAVARHSDNARFVYFTSDSPSTIYLERCLNDSTAHGPSSRSCRRTTSGRRTRRRTRAAAAAARTSSRPRAPSRPRAAPAGARGRRRSGPRLARRGSWLQAVVNFASASSSQVRPAGGALSENTAVIRPLRSVRRRRAHSIRHLARDPCLADR
jgi:hypothetical protein